MRSRGRLRAAQVISSLILVLAGSGDLLRAQSAPLSVLDVPYISQTEALCGGAAAAMVLRYWGERGIDAQSFAGLVDRTAAGIRTTTLIDDLTQRGWMAHAIEGSDAAAAAELTAGRPVLALIEDRPHIYHYVVIVGAQERAIIFHDPARSPFRVMRHDEFERRWNATDHWMAVIAPATRSERLHASTEDTRSAAIAATPSTEHSGCDALVADGVARAQRNDLEGAERVLTGALGCAGPAGWRELAGVRALQRRWPEAADLAATALAEDPHDEYAARLLGTSEFLRDQPLSALQAWNRIGEPRVDLVRVDGLVSTRASVVERMLGISTGDVLTPAGFRRAERRLADLPAASSTRISYTAVGSGKAEVHAVVNERPLFAHDTWTLGALGLSAIAGRSVTGTIGSVTGSGESVDVSWRFWPYRPAIGVGVQSPAPFGGVWGARAVFEEQPFTDASVRTVRRAGARFIVGNWVTSFARVTVRGGLDRWTRGAPTATAPAESVHVAPTVGGTLRLTSKGNRADVRFDADGWRGAQPFVTGAGTLRLRSSTVRQGFVFTGMSGAAFVSVDTPPDLWQGGDTGWVRPTLLRAHPIVSDGRLKADRLGRTIVHATAEAQHWWSSAVPVVRIGTATFVDTARVSALLNGSSRADTDIGVGARFSVLAFPGVLRVDAAHGLRDGADTISFVYVIE